ncbi:hypothetical protein [Roseovarius pacificus]|uniref:hypothetical protein n=1 Tax=Roseovarius pacificus TaxID=337701 RepID=UPI0009334E79|nr:hypothetical protein [Roseovarius pacificus]GGO52389.1 hypothetical protein GCM10011315_07800 [Roseovarius pacificus]
MADQDHQLTELFRALGAQRPEQWASSQIQEKIPQLHRYLFLKQAWAQVVDETDDSWIERIIESARRNPEGPFSGQGHALERMLSLGVDRSDIVDLVRCSQAEMISGLCYLLDDPSLYDEEDERVRDTGWCLVATDENLEPTREIIGGLHESVLGTDPTGREMRPRKRSI